jgi:hypothetical protein
MWSGPEVARRIEKKTGAQKEVQHAQRGREYMRGAGMRAPRFPQALQRQGGRRLGGAGGFRKRLPERPRGIEKAHPEAEVQLFGPRTRL